MIKNVLILITLIFVISANAQNIAVDSQTYTPQQLIEDILIDSDCISNVVVTNVVGGDFGGTDQSYGYFDANGSSFPFANGIVLGTGRLSNVPGPNNSISSDDASGWDEDDDLEIVLNEGNTHNATVIEFEFTALANQISFNYIFASEEYQEGDSSTCQFSDLFGFLIRPTNSNTYQNIALVPGTQTPVKVTTVHPEIPLQCPAENEEFFGSFNDSNAPINFNGQTAILTATAQIVSNQTYNVKLVIADEFNALFDSAVFIEAGSFESNTNLGQDRLIATNNPVCGNETITLDATTQVGTATYTWFMDGVEQTAETNATYDVSINGVYSVEVTVNNACISTGDIVIEYAQIPTTTDITIFECDFNQDGFTTYDLFASANAITNNDPDLGVLDFYLSLADAQAEVNPITNPNVFENSSVMQTVYASVANQLTNCKAQAEIILDISNNTLDLDPIDTCDDAIVDGFVSFNLDIVRTNILPQVPDNSTITFFLTSEDAFNNTNSLSNTFVNTVPDSQIIYVKVTTEDNQCLGISPLTLNILFAPQLDADTSFLYCSNRFPETITLEAGVNNDIPNNFYYQWLFNDEDTGVTTPFFNANQIGTYAVIVTDPNGCKNSRTIQLLPYDPPSIENLEFTQLISNNTATITVSGVGEYEFAIDNQNGFYQDENTFTNLEPGFHTIYVRDKNGCGEVFIEFSILGFPNFFTPNGDTVNDVWRPYGANKNFNNNLELLIFNRYGKLLATTTSFIGWDGALNGFILPSDDYWYIINHPNGTQYKGHFALIR